MQALVRRMILKGFRSIPSEAVDFSNPVFLVGRNGSGKSNFVDAFALLNEAMGSPLQAVFDRRGGISVVRNRPSGHSRPPNLGLAVVLGAFNDTMRAGRYAFEIKARPNYGFEIVREQCMVVGVSGERHWFERQGSEFRSSASGTIAPLLEPDLLALPVVAGDARFAPVLRVISAMRVYRIEPIKLREMQDPDGGVTLRSDGGNAASVLREIRDQSPEDLERIQEILESVVPNTRRVETIKHGNKLALRFTQEWGENKKLNFESYSMSDGTLRILGLILAVFQRPRPSLIVIEEPEATIHPGALGAVLDLLRQAHQSMQVIVTTHSPELLDAEWIQDEHLRIVSCDEGATHIRPLGVASRKALKSHLMGAGELLRSNALEAAPLFTEDLGQRGLFEDLA